jgi:hypothetical protein
LSRAAQHNVQGSDDMSVAHLQMIDDRFFHMLLKHR